MRLPLALLAPAVLLVAPSARADAPARSKLLANTKGKTVVRKVIQGNDMTVAVISRAGTAVEVGSTQAARTNALPARERQTHRPPSTPSTP